MNEAFNHEIEEEVALEYDDNIEVLREDISMTLNEGMKELDVEEFSPSFERRCETDEYQKSFIADQEYDDHEVVSEADVDISFEYWQENAKKKLELLTLSGPGGGSGEPP